ncbi:MAG: DNA-directed RNA polymerase subunit alpha [Endomicrobiaceae bacterium]|jgi:DNA-directed RNA polymerase subunit alpha|nr:DNA-directed RNA polymerase subunit alpha [Endomicrobiaceae bacterium]MDD4166606.1 DNA-directed RNA polymerase subunit alpha [Endomicrobiaceae bacterium]
MKTSNLKKLEKLQLEESTASKTFGRFFAQPFERGYGHTIGNSLRRILLSSIEGSAITSVNVTGASHEYSVIKGVREDVLQIMLNLKKVRVRLTGEGPETLYLKVSKAGTVKAKDIEKNASVEILNPDQEIANIDAGATLEMELEVSKGKGYVLAADVKNHKYSAGTIVMDALFSPVTKVNYEVENTRVDQSYNYDKLIMEVWTDGSITPQDALIESAKVLQASLAIFTGVASVAKEVEPAEPVEAKPEDKTEEVKSQPISILDLSTRASNGLKNEGIETIGELVKYSEDELLGLDKFGQNSLKEIKKKLDEIGLTLKEHK